MLKSSKKKKGSKYNSKITKTKTPKTTKKNKHKNTKKTSKNTTILTKTQYKKLDYPYRNIEITKGIMMQHFQDLKDFQPIVLNINPTKAKINKYQNRFVVFVENYFKYKNLYQITDYFSQKCRVKCIFNLKEDKSVLDLFQINKNKILSYLENKNKELTIHNINEYIWRHYRQCTNFNTTVVVSVLKFFKPSKVLDFSAGWGDRLVGAIACDVNYTGVDPSNCMNPIYNQIIKHLADKTANYKIIQDGYENVKLSADTYDLVFTSPPFFDMEIYENVETQSIEKFNSVIKWKKGFLYPALVKSHKYLKKNGHLALYITDYKNNSYIKDMKMFIKKNIRGLKYQGDLHWWDQTNKKTIRKIFVWKKIF